MSIIDFAPFRRHLFKDYLGRLANFKRDAFFHREDSTNSAYNCKLYLIKEMYRD